MTTATPLTAPILSPEKTSRPALHSSPTRSSTRRASRTPAKTRQSLIQSQQHEQCEEPSPSPRKAILKNPGAVSFTPKGVKKAPRAWERRPATPYVPRREGEKIWKRVVLGDLGGEVNRDVGRTKGAEDYVRAVKKLKMNDDEGVRVMTCVEDAGACATRKVPVNFGLAEGDCVRDLDGNGNSEEVLPMWEPDRETEEVANDETSEQSDDDSSYDEAVSSPDVVEATALVAGDDAVAHPHPSTELTLEDEEECAANEDRVDEQEPSPMVSLPQLDANPVVKEAEVTIASEALSTTQTSLAVENAAEEQGSEAKLVEADDFTNGSVTYPTLDTSELAKAEDLSPIRPNVTDESAESQQIRDETGKTPANLPAPESADVSQVHDSNEADSAVNTSQTVTSFEDEAQRGGEPDEESQAADAGESQDNTRPRPSLDDAAFLHAFLSRTKAQREARNLEKQEVDSQEAVPTAVEDGAEPAESTEVVESEIPVANVETEPELKAQDAVTEDDQTSPIRRSKRTATVQSTAASIPRIQLKRAVGSEFIFTANKSQTPANVAMMTRTNTKRNRGQAVGVSTRLDQLRTRLEGEDHVVEADEAGNVAKKRKRDKADKVELAAVAKKKVLRWNDDRLTAYREADAYVEEEMELERERERTPEMESGKEEDEQDEEMSALAKKISSPSKVRRVRRNVGAMPAAVAVAEGPANAAPAPLKGTAKGRSKRSASEQMGVEGDVPATEMEKEKDAKAAAVTGPRRSRMPVRVGRPGKAAGGEMAKSTKGQTQGNANGEAKADEGMLKRRLRVRS